MMSPSPVRQERTSASEGSALQNQITELLEGEQSYYDDLCLVETAFAEPLAASNPPIIPRSRLPAFLSEVLLNIDQIRTHSGSFLAALRLLQERDADANAVGDLVERAALEWGPAYHEYITRLPLADQRLRQEKTENPAFRDFLELFHDNPKACKRGFDTFHSRPTFRALRYILLLESILERCGTGGLRPASVERALVILRRQSAEADREIERTKQAAALRDLDHSFLFREDVVRDLNLRSPTRRLLHSGPVIWQLASGDQRSGFAFLFDHFLVFSKPPRPDREGRLRYIIKRRPVPLALVQLEPSSQPSATPTEPRHSFEGRSVGPGQRSAATDLHPVTYRQLGRSAGRVTFFVDSRAAADAWSAAISNVVTQRAPANPAFRRGVTFQTTYNGIAATLSVRVAGRDLLFAGGTGGVDVAWLDRLRDLRRVLHLSGVTHLARWAGPEGFLLVLAEGVLLAYPLDCVVPSGSGSISSVTEQAQRLSGRAKVVSFCTGNIGKTPVVMCMTHGGGQTRLTLLRLDGDPELRSQATPRKFKIMQLYSLAGVPLRIEILQGHLALYHRHHIEIMDMETMRTLTVPDLLPVPTDDLLPLVHLSEGGLVLGLFRAAKDRHLLVFDHAAFFVDAWGCPVGAVLFIWESRPQRAVAKDSRVCTFISIRLGTPAVLLTGA
ncbi:hypothetical protein JCM8115_002554 [Rhodotorula mucilaginosa]